MIGPALIGPQCRKADGSPAAMRRLGRVSAEAKGAHAPAGH
ncbi:hypothetical protein ACLBKT_03170 [Erythrobacter sp. W302b]